MTTTTRVTDWNGAAKTVVPFALPDDVYNRLRRQSRATGQTVGQFIAAAVGVALEAAEKAVPTHVPRRDWRGVLTTVIPTDGPGLTQPEVRKALAEAEGGRGVRRLAMVLELSRRVKAGQVERTGRGVRGEPYRYTLPAGVVPAYEQRGHWIRRLFKLLNNS